MVNSHQLHMLQNHETHWVTLYKIILMSTAMHALLGMYKLLVRPHPECAALVWNPHLIRNISKLENAWMFALIMRHNYFYFPPNVLYLSQVEFFTIIPPISTSCPHQLLHLFPAPSQFGTLFLMLLSLLLASLPSGHMLYLSSCNYALPYTQL